MAEITARGEGADADPALPADAEHIIVTATTFGGRDPDGFPEDETIHYERGDELPFEKHTEAVAEMPTELAALDADGNVVAGGKKPRAAGPDPSVSQPDPLAEALEVWKSGEGFDPSEYEATSD